MEKRLLLAVLLMGVVIMGTNLIFGPPVPVGTGVRADSVQVAPVVRTAPVARASQPQLVPTDVPPLDTVVVRSELFEYTFSTRGAALLKAELLAYPSYTEPANRVQLVPAGTLDFLAHRLAIGADTVDLRGAAFRASTTSLNVTDTARAQSVNFTYNHPSGFGVELTYSFVADEYVVNVSGRVFGVSGPATLLTELGPGLAPHEAFDHHSERELALVTRTLEDVDRERLANISGRIDLPGPFTWAGIKDKYFLAAFVADSTPIATLAVRNVPDVQQAFVEDGDTSVVQLPRARLTLGLPVAPDGSFSYRAYLGPQEYEGLAAVGHEFEDVTPYGYRWLQPIIRPFAALILWILNTLHNSLGLAYGWVLVVFGVMMRVVLWPLNAKAMRAQMKNAAVAPRMQEIREKYSNNPQKQQEEVMKLYKEEGFNPMAGCLPLLIPFPILITLFFVFQNTIVFRGAEFLWLPDLSLRDPFYILPVLLIASMFSLQWISTKLSGIEQNPQMKMMMYFMPLAIGFLFFTFPSGLNLYYLATNIASLPQQVMIARERRVQQEAAKASTTPPPPTTKIPKRRAKN